MRNVITAEKFIAGLGRDFFLHPDHIDTRGGAEKYIPGLGLKFKFEERHISEKGGYERHLHGLGRDFFVHPDYIASVGPDKADLVGKIAYVDYVVESADGSDVPATVQWVTAPDNEALLSAVKIAQVEVDNEESTEETVYQAVSGLMEAMKVYQDAKAPGTKTE